MTSHLSISDIKNAVLVVAHPDDEVLWFSSLLRKCKKIIVCYGETPNNKKITNGRKLSIEQYPLDNIEFLFLPESNAYSKGKWNSGSKAESPHGINLKNKDLIYEKNFTILSNLLEKRLSSELTVITHNPWGEYGHEEHIQIYQIIKNIQKKHKFCLVFNSYFSELSESLMMMYSGRLITKTEPITTDSEIVTTLSALYKKNYCWTWPNDYIVPKKESFYSLEDYNNNTNGYPKLTSSIPLNYIPFIKKRTFMFNIKKILIYFKIFFKKRFNKLLCM
ncbi:hypothetical protein N9E23_05085 [Candidatus Pelagibacter sp.]|nr:hypothetical protein [Candidatus Pelagibacter sp.]